MKRGLLIVFLFLSLGSTIGSVSNSSDLDYSLVSRHIIYYTNIERLKHGLPMFRYNPILQAGAQRHSQYMADHKYMSHRESVLKDPQDRVKASCKPEDKECMNQFENPVKVPGVPYLVCCSENVYDYHDADSTEEGLAKGMVKGWMNSPGHRANILDKDTSAMGAFVVPNAGRRYGTQVFSPYAKGGIVTKGNFKVKVLSQAKDSIVIAYIPTEVLYEFSPRVIRLDGGDNSAFSFELKGSEYVLTYQRREGEKNLPFFRMELNDLEYTDIYYPLCQFQVVEKEDKLSFEWKQF